jgi:GNAT superfamily N-acetyltransferase
MPPAASPTRPLPIRPRPMAGESPASYLRRLARANHLRPGCLRRYLRQPGGGGAIRLDWLAILAGRSQTALERALAGPVNGHAAGPGRRHMRQADKPRLFAAIRRDARDNGLSIRALADRHGVHRRTVRQALASPWPAPRKRPQRRSRLDPFKDVIDAMLLSGPDPAGPTPATVKQIFDRLVAEHEMTGVSYSTVRDYVAHNHILRLRAVHAAEGTVHSAMEISIRDALPGDARGIAALLTELGYPSSSDETAERLAEWRESPLSRVIVAATGHDVAGVLAFHAIPFLEHAGRRGRIVCLVVDEARRGQGVGTRLMQAAESHARRLGCTDIELTSSRDRTEAHAFYQRMGYHDCCDRSARFLQPLTSHP